MKLIKSNDTLRTMDAVVCEYQKFIGCPCCSPEYEQIISDTYETMADHDEECKYQDSWDMEHTISYIVKIIRSDPL